MGSNLEKKGKPITNINLLATFGQRIGELGITDEDIHACGSNSELAHQVADVMKRRMVVVVDRDNRLDYPRVDADTEWALLPGTRQKTEVDLRRVRLERFRLSELPRGSELSSMRDRHREGDVRLGIRTCMELVKPCNKSKIPQDWYEKQRIAFLGTVFISPETGRRSHAELHWGIQRSGDTKGEKEWWMDQRYYLFNDREDGLTESTTIWVPILSKAEEPE